MPTVAGLAPGIPLSEDAVTTEQLLTSAYTARDIDAALALEGVVKAYPNGTSSDDIQKIESEGHRKVVAVFIAGIERLKT